MTLPAVYRRMARVVIVAGLAIATPIAHRVSAVSSVKDGDKCTQLGVKIAGGSGVTFVCTKSGTKNVLKWKRAVTVTTIPNVTTTTNSVPKVTTASQVIIKDFSFTVAVGIKATDTVSVVNRDSSAHTMTSDTGAFHVSLAGGTTKSLPSLKSGTYEFHCEIHTSMRGTLTIL